MSKVIEKKIIGEININGGKLRRYDYGGLQIIDKYLAHHIVYEPGDGTRYDFYVFDIGHAFLIATEKGINYPPKVEKFYLKEPEEKAVEKILMKFPECNPYTVWAVVTILKGVLQRRN